MITVFLLQVALSQRFFLFSIRFSRLCKLTTLALTKERHSRCDKAGLRDLQSDNELFSLLHLLRQSREISIDSYRTNFIREYAVEILQYRKIFLRNIDH